MLDFFSFLSLFYYCFFFFFSFQLGLCVHATKRKIMCRDGDVAECSNHSLSSFFLVFFISDVSRIFLLLTAFSFSYFSAYFPFTFKFVFFFFLLYISYVSYPGRRLFPFLFLYFYFLCFLSFIIYSLAFTLFLSNKNRVLAGSKNLPQTGNSEVPDSVFSVCLHCDSPFSIRDGRSL